MELRDQMENSHESTGGVQQPVHHDSHSRINAATLRLALAPKGVLVKQVLGQLVVLSIHA